MLKAFAQNVIALNRGSRQAIKLTSRYFTEHNKKVLTRIYDAKVDYYKVLKVTPSATDKEIKEAFYKLSQTYHPDLTNGRTVEKFQKISNAYSIVGHLPTKTVYDQARKDHVQQQNSQNNAPNASDKNQAAQEPPSPYVLFFFFMIFLVVVIYGEPGKPDPNRTTSDTRPQRQTSSTLRISDDSQTRLQISPQKLSPVLIEAKSDVITDPSRLLN